MSHICPVCAFSEMPYPAMPYNICPCCGTEFGVDDRSQSHAELRFQWERDGFKWFDDITSPPLGWSPTIQLIKGGFVADLIQPTGSVTQTQQVNFSFPTRTFWLAGDLPTYRVFVGV